MSPRDTDERVTEARTMESGLGPVDAPPSAEQIDYEATRYADTGHAPDSYGWSVARRAWLAGANWRARQ